MFAKTIRTSIFLLAFIALTVSGCSRQEKEKVVIKGSTTVLPIAQKAQEAFLATHENITISLQGTGSGDGIKSIIEGTTDIANASRDMKDKEIESAKEAGREIESITVAHDILVPVVHPTNPVSEITIEQLNAMYKGEITNWSELGGKDMEIVLISRDTSSGTFEVWEELVMHGENVSEEALLQASNGAVFNAVSQNEKAIGYIGIGFISDSVKVLPVNGVAPRMDNLKEYPISRPLYMF
ncbi:MAG: phosphate ABC transporter substrate-binding protein, partial [Spirochaetota bacterium]